MPNDLAGSTIYTGQSNEYPWAGEGPILTDAGPALATIQKFQLCALVATGVTPFVVGTHTAAQAVMAMQPATTGKQVPYVHTAIVNHEHIIWPTDASLDTYIERRSFMTGTLKVSRLYRAE